MLSKYSPDNIVKVDVLLEALDNNAQEKILFNDVLILLGQHCTGKNLVQCFPKDSRQHCTRKNPVQGCLHSLRKTVHK